MPRASEPGASGAPFRISLRVRAVASRYHLEAEPAATTTPAVASGSAELKHA